MFEEWISLAGIFGTIGIGAGVYYKLGKVEQKIAFLYENCDIQITFRKHIK
jgi:hypothetical protein